MGNMKWRAAILRVLKDADGPLHYQDIAQQIIDNEYRTSVGATPANTGASYLGSDDMRPSVRRVSRGMYELEGSPGRADSAHPDTPAGGRYGTESHRPLEGSDPEEEMGLINAFGMFWMRREVDWSTRNPKLLGAQQSGSTPVDFSAQAGVYFSTTATVSFTWAG